MSERGYLDGVPLRLNSKFYPQPRPQFKEIDIHIPVDALQDEYDFSLERRTLMVVETWEEEHRLEQDRRALRAKQEEEERLQAEKERKKLKEQERIRLAAEEVVRLAAEEVDRVRLIEEEKDRERRDAEKVRLLQLVVVAEKDEEQPQQPQYQPTPTPPPPSSQQHPQQQQQQQWNNLSNYYVPSPPVGSPSSADLISQQVNNVRTANPTTTTCPTNAVAPPASSINSFKKYYFPLLTSMADSRSLRDRHLQYSTDLNQAYNNPQPPPQSSVNQQILNSSQNNPYLSVCANPPSSRPPDIQHFPILGSLSQQPSHADVSAPNGTHHTLG